MAVQQQVDFGLRYHVSLETTNKSFIDMYYYLINIGVPKNKADFMLRLYDPALIGVDPFDYPRLTQQLKARIAIECGRNIWYFLRECVRISTAAGKIRYKLHRGNMAQTYLFERNYNQYDIQPRQFGKTIGSCCCYLWVYNFASRNSEILFYHKDHGGSKSNLKTVKELRDNLPEYLQMKAEAMGQFGRKIKVPNTVETANNPITMNRIVTLPSARSEDQADKIARGRTSVFIYFDEYAFMPYNKTVYAAAGPAFSTAANVAKSVGAHYGIMITTTPGDLTTDEGLYAYQARNDATLWRDDYYKLSDQELKELNESNTNSNFFHVEYNYKQLGRGDDYLKEMVILLQRNWAKIRREVLLEWSEASDNNPFSKEDLSKIKDLCRDPIRTIYFGRHNQYAFNVYEDVDLRFPPIVGVDVSGALYNDSSAVTIIDSRSTRVVADFNCNYIPADDLADLLYTLVTRYMPNAIINVERSGGFGISVLQRLCKTSIKKNLYFEIKDKVIEESFNGVHLNKKKARVKVYGTDTTRDVRARMIELLYERVAYHKDKFISKILQHELETLIVDKHGKVQAVSPHHDDQIFAYLHAIRVWYEGENVAERYGIRKNVLKTDEDIEIESSTLDQEEDLKSIDVEELSRDITDGSKDIVAEQMEFIKDASKYHLQQDFNRMVFEEEQQDLNLLINTNKDAKEAYNRKYHIDGTAPNQVIQFVDLPDNAFGTIFDTEEEEILRRQQQLHGNLYDKLMQLK